MDPQTLRSIVLVTLLMGATGVLADQPFGASPGSPMEVTTIDQRCPTFSWGAVERARGYELVVYRLQVEVGTSLEATEPVLRERVPGGALSWTPPMARCVSPGGRYAWSVRAHVDEGVSAWSEPRLFRVAAGPSQGELRRALTLVLEEYVAQGGRLEDLELRSGDAGAGGEVSADSGEEAGEAEDSGRSTASDRSRATEGLPDPAAISGLQSDPAGTTVGVAGTSASPDGFGLGGANTAGGGDLLLDGSADAETDTVLTQAGLDRASASPETFTVENSAGGGMTLAITGSVGVTGLVDGVDVSAHAGEANAHHTPPASLPPSGPAGGDLAGTFPDPDVVDDSHLHSDGTLSETLSIANGRLFAPAGAGNVGIGTTTPTEALTVIGSVEATSFIGDGSGLTNVVVGADCQSGGRYEDNGDGTVTDCRTGLIWLQDASCDELTGGAKQIWSGALSAVAALADGTCGLTDGSPVGFWRLPSIGEWMEMVASAVKQGFTFPALTNAKGDAKWTTDGDAFNGVDTSCCQYWSINEVDSGSAWDVDIMFGNIDIDGKFESNWIWPVRDGLPATTNLATGSPVASCSDSEIVVGGGCDCDPNAVRVSEPFGNGWTCNCDGSPFNGSATAVCLVNLNP